MPKVVGTTAVRISGFDVTKLMNKPMMDKLAKELGPLRVAEIKLVFEGFAPEGVEFALTDPINVRVEAEYTDRGENGPALVAASDPVRSSKVFDIVLAAAK